MVDLTRRRFIRLAAPAIVRAPSLMRISAQILPAFGLLGFKDGQAMYGVGKIVRQSEIDPYVMCDELHMIDEFTEESGKIIASLAKQIYSPSPVWDFLWKEAHDD